MSDLQERQRVVLIELIGIHDKLNHQYGKEDTHDEKEQYVWFGRQIEKFDQDDKDCLPSDIEQFKMRIRFPVWR